MRIAEIYKSIQGEGLLTGTQSVFVRTSGCNLRCEYCDTPYTSWQPEGDDLSVDDVIQHAASYDCSHTVVTGGEPMLLAEMIPLCQRLKDLGQHITMETAGTLYLPLACDLMSISPKMSNSTPADDLAPGWRLRHEQVRHAPEVVRRLIDQYAYQLKFVIDTPRDCDEVNEYLQSFSGIDRHRVLLMPQGTDVESLAATTEWLEPYCHRHNYRFCPRRQIEWFGHVRGT